MDAKDTSSERKPSPETPEPSPEKPETTTTTDEKQEKDQKNNQEPAGSELSTPPKSITGRTPQPEWRTPPNRVRLSSRTPPPAPRSQKPTSQDNSRFGYRRIAHRWASYRRQLAGINLSRPQDQEAQRKLLDFDPFQELQVTPLKRKREDSPTPDPQDNNHDQAL
ncbi:hypothetical protein N7493_002437 [Penicillium malachiteum]|uniref:Uncharacterized protein n=1 Tax=Penicillium malachiteum TaxID=1324776 RepID=A0AAD6HRU8_9EURO|nr:hypothetical protein N7493_002437 [Penicillium malachiteum]